MPTQRSDGLLTGWWSTGTWSTSLPSSPPSPWSSSTSMPLGLSTTSERFRIFWFERCIPKLFRSCTRVQARVKMWRQLPDCEQRCLNKRDRWIQKIPHLACILTTYWSAGKIDLNPNLACIFNCLLMHHCIFHRWHLRDRNTEIDSLYFKKGIATREKPILLKSPTNIVQCK